ncbi:hypothetical protein [Proteus hauseri]|uniref:hypothetical protein n=1 Tax=Proteus hauseri TaxID=183417 RepID=UPI0032DA86AA
MDKDNNYPYKERTLIKVNKDNSDVYSNDVNNNLVFMLSKQSRFEIEAREEKQKFNQLFKSGFDKANVISSNQYINSRNSTIKTNNRLSVIMSIPEPVWNENKQKLELKWNNKPRYIFDAY